MYWYDDSYQNKGKKLKYYWLMGKNQHFLRIVSVWPKYGFQGCHASKNCNEWSSFLVWAFTYQVILKNV